MSWLVDQDYGVHFSKRHGSRFRCSVLVAAQWPVVEDVGPLENTAADDGPLHAEEFDAGIAQDSEATSGARTQHQPDEPSLEERRRHEDLHEPYRSWCAACVASRGRM
eukprot:3608787-Karenia_brevis.AAC.1